MSHAGNPQDVLCLETVNQRLLLNIMTGWWSQRCAPCPQDVLYLKRINWRLLNIGAGFFFYLLLIIQKSGIQEDINLRLLNNAMAG
jgi:hypothetical protein